MKHWTYYGLAAMVIAAWSEWAMGDRRGIMEVHAFAIRSSPRLHNNKAPGAAATTVTHTKTHHHHRCPSESGSRLRALVLDVDGATELTQGTLTLPPMASVPCSCVVGENNITSDGDQGSSPSSRPLLLTEIVQPPSVEALYDWYAGVRKTPDADPSWGVVWPTAMALAQHLEAHGGSMVRGKHVVELGAGLGLAGLVAGALGAASVVLTDREPVALHCALASAACNQLGNVKGALLDWEDPVLPDDPQACDVVLLATDVLYDGDTIAAFASACNRLLEPSGGTLLVADPKQERFPGARETLREALMAGDGQRTALFEATDLPPVVVAKDAAADAATTLEGRDHVARMSEPTVLIRYTVEPKN